jgi:hypothetical protein
VSFGVGGIVLNEPNNGQGHQHGSPVSGQNYALVPGGGGGWNYGGGSFGSQSSVTAFGVTGLTIGVGNTASTGLGGYQGIAVSGGKGTAATSVSFSNLPPFLLVTFYMKL